MNILKKLVNEGILLCIYAAYSLVVALMFLFVFDISMTNSFMGCAFGLIILGFISIKDGSKAMESIGIVQGSRGGAQAAGNLNILRMVGKSEEGLKNSGEKISGKRLFSILFKRSYVQYLIYGFILLVISLVPYISYFI